MCVMVWFSISIIGSRMVISVIRKLGCDWFLWVLNSLLIWFGLVRFRCGVMKLLYRGLVMIMVGMVMMKFSSMVVFRLVCSVDMVISGFGCGGSSVCKVVMLVSVGMVMCRIGSLEWCVMMKMIGVIIISFILKNSGRLIISVISVII